MKRYKFYISVFMTLFLLSSCVVFPMKDECDRAFDATLAATGSYRLAFDTYYACREGE